VEYKGYHESKLRGFLREQNEILGQTASRVYQKYHFLGIAEAMVPALSAAMSS
jgi:hypothetical protein